MSSTSSTGKRWRFWKRQPDKNKKEAGGLEHECLLMRVDEQSRTIVSLKNECERLEQARLHMHTYKTKCQNMESKMAEQTKQLEIERLKLEECLQKAEKENKLLLEKTERMKNHDTYNSSHTNGSCSKGSNSSSNKNSLNKINGNQESNHNDTTLTYKKTTDNKNKSSKNIILNEMDQIKNNIIQINATNHMDNKLNHDNTLDLTSITNNYIINHNKSSTKLQNSNKNPINTNNNNEDTLKSCSDVACNKCDMLLISQQKYIAQIESLRQSVSRLEKENLLLHGLFQECMNANGMSFDSRAVTSISPPPGYNHLFFDSTLTNGHFTKINNINNNSNNNSYNSSNNNINNRNKPTAYVTDNNHQKSQSPNHTRINNNMVNNMIENTPCWANNLTSFSTQTQASPLKSPMSDDGNVSDQSILSQTLGHSSHQPGEYFKDASMGKFSNHETRIDTRRRSSLSLNDFLDGEIGSGLERSNNFESIDLYNHNYPCDFTDPFNVFSEPFNELTSGFSSFESDLKTRLGRDELSISSKSTFLISTDSLKGGQNGFMSNGEDCERTLKRGTQKECGDYDKIGDWVENVDRSEKFENKKDKKETEEEKDDEDKSEVSETDKIFVNKAEENRKIYEIAKSIKTKNVGVEERGLEGIVGNVDSIKDEERNEEASSWEVSSMSSVECSSLFVGSFNEHEEEEVENENSSADEVFKNEESFTKMNDVLETNHETSYMTYPNVNVKTSTENVSANANNSHNITENDTSISSFNSSNNPAYTQESSEDEDSQSPFLKRLQCYFNEHPSIDDSLLGSRRRIHEKRKSLDDSVIRSTSSSFYPNKPLLSTHLRVDLRVLRDKVLNNDVDQMELRKMINLFKTNEGHAVLSDNTNSVIITKDKVSALKNYFEGKTTLKMSRRKKFKSVDERNGNKINQKCVDKKNIDNKNNLSNNSKKLCIHNSADNNVRNKQNLGSTKCEKVDSTTTTTIASNKYKTTITKVNNSYNKDTNHTRTFEKDKHTTNNTSFPKSCSNEINHFIEENFSEANDETTNGISNIVSPIPKTKPFATISTQFTKKSSTPSTPLFQKSTIITASPRNTSNLLSSSKIVSSPNKTNNHPKSNNFNSNNNNTKHPTYGKSPMSIKKLELDNKNNVKNVSLNNQSKLKTQTSKTSLILTPKQTRKNTNNKPNATNKKTISANIIPASPQKQCKSKRNIEKSPMPDKKSMKPIIPNKPKIISEHKTPKPNKIPNQNTTHNKNATHTPSNTPKQKHQSSTTSPLVKISMRSASVPSPLMPLRKNKQPASFTIAIAKTTSLRSFALKQYKDKNTKSRFDKEGVVNENFLKDSSLTASSSILNDIEKYKLNAIRNNTLRSYTPKPQTTTSTNANDYSYNEKFFLKDLPFVQEIVSENGKRRNFENNFEKREDIKQMSRSSSSSGSSIYWVSDKAPSNINSPDTLKVGKQSNKNKLNVSGHKYEYDKIANTTDRSPNLNSNVRSAHCRKHNDNSSKDSQGFVASTPPSSKLCKPSIKTQKHITNDTKIITISNNVNNNNLNNTDPIKIHSNLNSKQHVLNNNCKSQNNKNVILTPRNNRSKAIKEPTDKIPIKTTTATCGCRNKAAKDPPRPLRQKTSAVKTNGSVMLKSTSSSIRTSSSSLSSEPTHHSLLSLPYVARDMYVENRDDLSHTVLNEKGMENLEGCLEKENKNICQDNLLNDHSNGKEGIDLTVNMILLEALNCNPKIEPSSKSNKIQKEIILKRKVENSHKISKTDNKSSNPFSKTSILSKEASRGWMRRKPKSSTPSCMRMSPEVLSIRNHNIASKPSINHPSINHSSINHPSINHPSINQNNDKSDHSNPSYSLFNQSHSSSNLQNSSNNHPSFHPSLKSPPSLSSNKALNISRLPLSVFKAY